MGMSDSVVMLLPYSFEDRFCTIQIETIFPYKLLLVFEFSTNMYDETKCLESVFSASIYFSHIMSKVKINLLQIPQVHDDISGIAFDLCEIQQIFATSTGKFEQMMNFALSEKVSIAIRLQKISFIDSIKIIATAARSQYCSFTEIHVLTSNTNCVHHSFFMKDITSTSLCEKDKEINCVLAENKFCLTSEVQCDGHPNCGAIGKYDEDFIKCGGIIT